MTTLVTSRGRPRNAEATRAIEAVALRQLDRLGYAQVSMESVAHEAGVARATIYRRYKDKADLITAAVAANAAATGSPTSSADPKADVIAFLEEFDQRFGEGCLEVIGSLLGSHDDHEGLALHRERIVQPRTAYLRGLLVRAQELGVLDGSLDVDLVVQMLAGSVFARRVFGAKGPSDWVRRVVDTIWR